MSRHRPDQVTAVTRTEPDDDDLTGLAREASTRLAMTAAAVDEQIERVAEASARTTRRGLLLGLIAVSVVLIASIALNLYTLNAALTNSQQTAALTAGEQASSDVAAARASSLLVARRDLSVANEALRAAGLTEVTVPLSANAYQVAEAVGEARGTLRVFGEQQRRGVRLPGVDAPDPASPRFPRSGD